MRPDKYQRRFAEFMGEVLRFGKRIGEHDGGRAPKTAKARGKPQANPGQAWGQDDLRLLL